MKLILFLALLPSLINAQDIPCGAHTMAIRGITFNQVCTSLLDSGYVIDKKDNDLQTVRTMQRAYPKRFSATYVINARIKDSVAYFNVTFSAPADGSIVRNEPSLYKCKKNGKPIDNIFTYPFLLVNFFVKGISSNIEYKIY